MPIHFIWCIKSFFEELSTFRSFLNYVAASAFPCSFHENSSPNAFWFFFLFIWNNFQSLFTGINLLELHKYFIKFHFEIINISGRSTYCLINKVLLKYLSYSSRTPLIYKTALTFSGINNLPNLALKNSLRPFVHRVALFLLLSSIGHRSRCCLVIRQII